MEAVATPTASSTPTSSPATPAAAPATSAPSTSESTGQRPTFAQAFAQDAALTSQEPAAPTETAATVPAADPASVESAQGPIPFTVHKTALENARTKAAEQARQEFDTQYGWAKALDRTQAEAGAQIGRLYAQDRPGFIRQVLAEAMADPQMAPLVRSEAARALGTRGPAQPTVDLSPDIPVMDANGQVVAQAFSADRMKQVVNQAIQDALGKELGPIKQDYETRQQRDAAQRQAAELQTNVNDIYAEVSDLPGFEEHKDAIAKVFATLPGDPAKALRTAWKQVVGSTLGSRDQVKADTLKELQTRAAASTVNPAAAVVSATDRPRSFTDARLKWS